MKQRIPDRTNLDAMYHAQAMSLAEIGVHFGVTKVTVGRWLVRHGLIARHTGPQSGRNNPSWKGGVTSDKDGYILRYLPNHPFANRGGYVREHRLVMEKKIGRYLRPEEVPHHKDDDPSNNHPENLELFDTNGKHLAATRRGKRPKWTEAGIARMNAAAERQMQAFPDDLLVQYQTKTSTQIAAEIGCQPQCVLAKLRSLGATIRAAHPQPKGIVAEDLVDLRNQFGSTHEFALHLGIGDKTARNRLRKLGFVSVDHRRVVNLPSHEELVLLRKNHSQEILAKMFGCSRGCIVARLKKPSRTSSVS